MYVCISFKFLNFILLEVQFIFRSSVNAVVGEALCLSVIKTDRKCETNIETIAPVIMHFVHVYCLCVCQEIKYVNITAIDR